MRSFTLALLFAFTVSAADNSLTPEEKRGGWKLLFDGKTFKNWKSGGESWAIEDGCLVTRANPTVSQDLITKKAYRDFELQFEWKVSEGGNTGLKYRIQRALFVPSGYTGPFEAAVQRQMEHPGPRVGKGQEYTIAYEMQLIDDERHPDAKRGDNHGTGSLYSMIAPTVGNVAHPAGHWNQARLVVKGNHFEHWINGRQVLSGSLDDPKGLSNLKDRWKNAPAVYEALAKPTTPAPFSLQHHGDKVWFRNIRVR